MATRSDSTSGVVTTTDENTDGRLDQRDDRIAAKRATKADAPAGDTKVDIDDAVSRAQMDTGLAVRRRSATASGAAAATLAPAVDADQPVVEVASGPRPRASLTATLSLILGVVAALSVLTGVLAGPGVAVGLIAAAAGLAGVAATRRRHVAGRGNAFLGVALGLGAIAIGVLALSGQLSWLSGDTDQVMRAHDWIAAHASWLLP